MDEVPLKPEHKPAVTWGPVAAVLVTLGVFFGGQITGIVLLVAALSIINGSTFDAVLNTVSSTSTGTIYQFFSVVLVEAVTLGLLFSFLRARRASFATLGLKGFRFTDLLRAVAGYGVYFIVYLLAALLAKGLFPSLNFEQEQEIGFSTAINGLGLVPIFISLVVLPPVVEEILVRGFLYTGLRTKFKPILSVLVTSVLFAIAHLQWGAGAPLLWVAAIDTFVLSVVLCYLRETTGRLAAPIMLHAIKNGIAFAALFVFKLV